MYNYSKEVVVHMKYGLALSGGGIRSFSQLPIIQAIQEEGIAISAISGTSMGSVIAALYACGLSTEEISDIVLDIEEVIEKEKVFKRPSLKVLPFSKEKLYGGYVDGAYLEDLLIKVLKPLDIHLITDVKIPLAIPSVDLITGKNVIFVSHPELFTTLDDDWDVISDVPLSLAVRASCSFPFVIGAVEFRNYRLVDGGLTMNLPVELIQAYGVKKTIGVTMHSESEEFFEESIPSLGARVMDIMRIQSDKLAVENTDVVINVPMDTIQIFSIGRGRDTIKAGEETILKNHDVLHSLVYKEPWYKCAFLRKRK